MLTDTAPKGGYTPTLFTMLDADLGELHTSRHLVNKGNKGWSRYAPALVCATWR